MSSEGNLCGLAMWKRSSMSSVKMNPGHNGFICVIDNVLILLAFTAPQEFHPGCPLCHRANACMES